MKKKLISHVYDNLSDFSPSSDESDEEKIQIN